jgi:hypothetical protein
MNLPDAPIAHEGFFARLIWNAINKRMFGAPWFSA